VKVKALVTPDGQCIQLSRVYRGATHDTAIFDSSEVAQFLTYQDERDQRMDLGGDRGTQADGGRGGMNRRERESGARNSEKD
jgi:hypothetical protein